jgi:hypothetical protein
VGCSNDWIAVADQIHDQNFHLTLSRLEDNTHREPSAAALLGVSGHSRHDYNQIFRHRSNLFKTHDPVFDLSQGEKDANLEVTFNITVYV